MRERFRAVGLTVRRRPGYCYSLGRTQVSKIVLCVDDSATMQMVADITFRGTDFQYVGARSVDEALQKAKAQKPAVVLADAQMTGKSGYDLCLALKQDAATADVPVVILVGNSAPYDAAKGTQVGADANLPKPWDTQTMLEKVTEIVGKGATAKPGQAAAAASAPAHAHAPAPAAAAAKSTPAAAAAVAQPPRSATMMGMPTIRMPAGVAPSASGPTAMPTNKTPAPVAPSPAVTVPGPAGPGAALRPPATAPAASHASSATPAVSGIGGMNRPPLVAGSASKRSALVERTLAKMAARLAEAAGLEPGSPELLALLKLSTEVVERIVWEVVPDLAEQIIRENLDQIAAAKRS
ncbi:MAG: response regulator [Acidobacteriota bacterium]